jgi:hypothetical protein
MYRFKKIAVFYSIMSLQPVEFVLHKLGLELSKLPPNCFEVKMKLSIQQEFFFLLTLVFKHSFNYLVRFLMISLCVYKW